MKNLLAFVLLFAAALLFAGCASYPNVVADHWVHSGNYGVVTTRYEATSITRVGDGFHIGTYSGSITVLGGYGVSDTINGLTITPKGSTPQSTITPGAIGRVVTIETPESFRFSDIRPKP